MKLDRRGFLMTSFAAGSSALLPACETLEPPPEPADGSYARPFTRADPGPHAGEIERHQPIVYAALVDERRIRFWIEVRDVVADLNHEMTADHFVQRILLADEFYNVIEDRAFRYDNEARLVVTVEIPPEVTRVYAYQQCSKYGWWRAEYDVESLRVAPVGDARRAFTDKQPGPNAAQVPTHVPRLGKRPNGQLSVEVGDPAAGGLHPQVADHYIKYVLIYDQYDQLRQAATLTPGQGEAVYDFPPVGGTDRLRVLVFCNQYNWWEAEFSVPEGAAG